MFLSFLARTSSAQQQKKYSEKTSRSRSYVAFGSNVDYITNQTMLKGTVEGVLLGLVS